MDQQRRIALKEGQLLTVGAFADPAPDKKREAPTEFRIFHAGVNESKKGPFLFDDRAAALVMRAFQARRTPMMMDYEHMSVAQPPVIAPNSATELQLEIRRDAAGGPELWATNVVWTTLARTMLENGEYRLFSPLFLSDKSTPPRVVELENIALTNLPALLDIEPLVAASSANPTQGAQMDPKEKEEYEARLKELSDKLAASEGEKEKMVERCKAMDKVDAKLKQLGVSFDDWAKEESAEHEEAAGSKEEAASLAALKDAALQITGAKDVATALGLLTGMATQHAELMALKTRTEADAAKALDAQFDTMLDQAVTQLKVPPAMKGTFVALKTALGTEKAFTALKAAIPADPVVQGEGSVRQAGGELTVDADEIEVASRLGIPLSMITDQKKKMMGGAT